LLAQEQHRARGEQSGPTHTNEGAVRAVEVGEVDAPVALGDARVRPGDVAILRKKDVAAFAPENDRLTGKWESAAVLCGRDDEHKTPPGVARGGAHDMRAVRERLGWWQHLEAE